MNDVDECPEYTRHLLNHQKNVMRAFMFICATLEIWNQQLNNLIRNHDSSKWSHDEYSAYADHFSRGIPNDEEFQIAHLLHFHRNPHHWQYWVFIDNSGKVTALDMPYNYIIEMLCDWHSFSAKDQKSTAYVWYDKHSANMVLSPKTRETIESLILYFREPLKGE